MEDSAAHKRALENFVTGNRDLAALEAMVSRFNIFEALGVVNAELRHSSFLAFLLNPRESHGLGDVVLKRLLQETLQGNQAVSVLTPIEIDIGDFSDCEVQVETDNIDIVLKFPKHNLAVIIENKINSNQHDDQLARYYEQTVYKNHGFEVFGIYLTRYADASGHPNYASLSHAAVCKVVTEIMSLPRVTLDRDVKVILSQYTEMLGRHFMADENIKELCMKIYQHHKQAIDLIIENLPNQRDVIAKELKMLVNKAGLILDDDKVQTIRFIPKSLDIPYFRGGSGWSKSGRMVLFEFLNTQNSLQVGLYLGPGEDSKRSQIFASARTLGKPFNTGSTLYAKWNSLYKCSLLEETDYMLPTEDLLAKLRANWTSFLIGDFILLSERVSQIQ
jgi:hypothetical protein